MNIISLLENPGLLNGKDLRNELTLSLSHLSKNHIFNRFLAFQEPYNQ